MSRSPDTIWRCKVGILGQLEVPDGGDAPMRDAIYRAFRRTIGVDPEFTFTFSGWSAELTEAELAVVEDREPDRSKVTREIPYDVTEEMVDRGWRASTHEATSRGDVRAILTAALATRDSQDPKEA